MDILKKVFINYFYIGFPLMILLDFVSILLYKVLTPKETKLHHNMRWFFIHFITNVLIAYYGFSDLKYCIYNIGECAMSPWSENSSRALCLAFVSHIYHMICFNKLLRRDEWIHHIIMCFVSGPLTYKYNMTKPAIIALWFMSGFPGAIDYFLLWLVKLNLVKKKVEKECYILISVLIRSPGCLFAVFLQLGLIGQNLKFELLLMRFIVSILTFWNGQYYMYMTVKDSSKLQQIKFDFKNE